MTTPSPHDRNPSSADAPADDSASAAFDIALRRCQHCNNVLHKEDGDGDELCRECMWDWAIR